MTGRSRSRVLPTSPSRGKALNAGSGEGPPTGWVWGKHAGLAALENPARVVISALATRNALKDLPEAVRSQIELAEPKALAGRLPPGAVHQGLAVECKALKPSPLSALIDGAGPLVVLDQVTDPHNVGAVVRSAAAFGAAGVVLQDRKAPPFFGACAKAAVGAVERMPHARVANISRALAEIAEAGRATIGLAGEGALDVDAALDAAAAAGGDASQSALALGSEDKGLRPSVMEACAFTARIPIRDAVESLNVSTAAAVALYAVGQRRPS